MSGDSEALSLMKHLWDEFVVELEIRVDRAIALPSSAIFANAEKASSDGGGGAPMDVDDDVLPLLSGRTPLARAQSDNMEWLLAGESRLESILNRIDKCIQGDILLTTFTPLLIFPCHS